MPISNERLREIVTELISRPRHEKVRALIYELLVHGLGASSAEVDFERPAPEVRGRIDALLGRTVFEFKSDLRRERGDVERRMPDYLRQRETEMGEHYVGIATDGEAFIPYELRNGSLRQLVSFTPSIESPRELLTWLSSAVAVSAELEPTPEIVRRELGRGSLAWQLAEQDLMAIWEDIQVRPDARLKRDLWARLLERVYGSPVEADTLFFQHTYLSIIAKTMALHIIGLAMPDPQDLMDGKPFYEAGISGAVEADFFDWPLSASAGSDLVRRIALQAARFRLRDVKTDVLKGLYESLIDPEQRYKLGEYYTPDWLAARMCQQAIDRPLEQRVFDPSCGSGTFLFHSARRILEAAQEAGVPNRQALELVTTHVFGVDIHPVAAQIARVTFLLALGEERLRDRPSHLSVPVYLGDSLQWNTSGFLAEREVQVEVPGSASPLEFPFEVARDPSLFDEIIGQMLAFSEQAAPVMALENWLGREHPLNESATEKLARTYESLRELQSQGRDHIWGFVVRNLARPVWLSQEAQRVDVILGNPPWLPYRFMSREMQERLRDESQRRGIWAGGRVATHQDLSAYFFVRCVELYLKAGGLIAFVMPFAAMSRQQFEGFRSGRYETRGSSRTREVFATVEFVEAWALSEDVQPLFPVPACVLFARSGRSQHGRALPAMIKSASGALPRRDAAPEEAEEYLDWEDTPWPTGVDESLPWSPYREVFQNGATVYPRAVFLAAYAPVGSLGINSTAPIVQSRRTNQEKAPWKDLPTADAHLQGIPLLRGNVESCFLKPLYLGESIAPFRTIEPTLAVIPWSAEQNKLLDASEAQTEGNVHLAAWLRQAEDLWNRHRRGSMSLTGQLDYFRKLTAQFPPPEIRVVYGKAGSLPAAAILRDPAALVDHKLYWGKADSDEEALYLLSILNSETARSRTQHLQSRGQWGARDFDKVMLSLPIPTFDAAIRLHKELAEAASHAENVAVAVPIRANEGFVRIRQRVREALREDGVAGEIDGLVTELLA